MKITENKKFLCQIILPENPTLREKFAADELKKYIQKISCAEFGEMSGCEKRILIGGPERNKAAKEIITKEKFNEIVPGPEGFLIYSKENVLLLAGSNDAMERGTVYAVYEFLERFLGCSLAVYSKQGVDAGEFIPQTDIIEIKDINYVKSCADVPYRTAIVQYDSWVSDPNHELNGQFISWLCKNRYNRILTWASIYEGYKINGMLEEANKRGIVFSVGHHESTQLFLPPEGNKYFPEKYYETHPEYYKLLPDGTRHFMKKGDYNGQFILCARNEEGIKTVAKNIISWLEKNPQADTICLWPNDGNSTYCMCSECQKYSKTANYTYFVDSVARLVNSVKPQVKIDQIAYGDILDCESEKISSSVIIDEATWHSCGLRKVGKPDGSCLNGTVYEDVILKWKNSGAEVVYYDYLMGNYGAFQKWMPVADEMQAICKRFCEKGIKGLGTQFETFNMWNNVFNYYTYGRTAYDTALSLADNMERFCKIFGSASEIIKEIILYGENIVDGQCDIEKSSTYLIKNIDLSKVYTLYEKALETAETKLARNNVRLMRMVFRYSHLKVEKDQNPENDNGEIYYMSEKFNSYLSGKEGYGIAICDKDCIKGNFEPDYWYAFE
ncbi:MAG: DUF4838 domain-containing protein [Clostridia bacterium]|nr:DUF4838 domain-containing protein [Clostridia bacterium]